MPNIYVVQQNETTELYLADYNPAVETQEWVPLANAQDFGTIEEANRVALEIGGGTVGTTKPLN